MKEILAHIVNSLVTNKNKVQIVEDVNDNVVHFQVTVDQADFGKVIGQDGKIAKSIRSIMGAIATLENIKVVVDIR